MNIKQTRKIEETKKDFPIFERKINGHNLIYLDSTATTQKPIQVIEAISDFYKNHNANIHRGLYLLSQESSEMYDNAHKIVAEFINAKSEQEVIFTKNTTESLNIIVNSLKKTLNLVAGDEIVISEMEHHSNLVAWQILEKEIGIILKYIKITKNYELDMQDAENKITKKTKIISITQMSNVLGTINNIKQLSRLAHDVGAVLVVDGAQSVPHMKIDVQQLGCDFLIFSGHKMLAPTGIGVLYGKKELLEKMEPFVYGGDMIKSVDFHDVEYAGLPWKFEAGTSNISGGIGLAKAIEYLKSIGMENVFEHDIELTEYALEKLKKVQNVKIIGPQDVRNKDGIIVRGGIISFIVEGMNPNDISLMLAEKGICVRSGFHCAQPLSKKLDLENGTIRISFYVYNTKEDVDVFIDELKKIVV